MLKRLIARARTWRVLPEGDVENRIRTLPPALSVFVCIGGRFAEGLCGVRFSRECVALWCWPVAVSVWFGDEGQKMDLRLERSEQSLADAEERMRGLASRLREARVRSYRKTIEGQG